jgi:hypothetical protein
MGSSIDIAKALSLNQTLTYLDLSFNGLGPQAGEYIGDALQHNHTIETLLLENNQLNGSAVYCICVGVMENTSLTRISLDKNPIGEFGAKSVVQVHITVFALRAIWISIFTHICIYFYCVCSLNMVIFYFTSLKAYLYYFYWMNILHFFRCCNPTDLILS